MKTTLAFLIFTVLFLSDAALAFDAQARPIGVPDWQFKNSFDYYNLSDYQKNGTLLTKTNTFYNGTATALNSTFFYFYLDNVTIASQNLSQGGVFFTVVPTSFAAYTIDMPLEIGLSYSTNSTNSTPTEPDTYDFDGNTIQAYFSQPNAGYYLIQVYNPSNLTSSTNFVIMVTTSINQNFLGARGKSVEGNITNANTPISYYIYRDDATTKTIVQLENCYGTAQMTVLYPDNTTANVTNGSFYLQGPVGTYMVNVSTIENASLSYGSSMVYTIQAFEVAANFTIPTAYPDGLAVLNVTRQDHDTVNINWPTLFFPTAEMNTYVLVSYVVTITQNYEGFPVFWRCNVPLGYGTLPEFQQSTYYNNMSVRLNQSGAYYIGMIAHVEIMNMTTQVPSLSVHYATNVFLNNDDDHDDHGPGKSVAIAFLVILIIAVVMLGIFLMYKRYKRGREDKEEFGVGTGEVGYGQPGYGRRDDVSPANNFANQVKSNFAVPDGQNISPQSPPSMKSSDVYQANEYNPDAESDL